MEHFRRNRVLRMLAGALVVEAGLLLVGRMAPAMWGLVWAGTVVVAIGFGVAARQAGRDRAGDRRQDDRRRG